jgi:predicted secreted protein
MHPPAKPMFKALAQRARLAIAVPTAPHDPRGRRMVAVIDCMLNQNARDAGAARFAAMAWDVVQICHEHGVGIVQMPCPEIACLGAARARPAGLSLRAAVDTPAGRQCCAQISTDVADRLQGYVDAGYSVLAVLGGNPQSPGCAVHQGAGELAPRSGVLMLALQAELRRRGLEIQFRGMRDSDTAAWAQDLQWLRQTLAGTAPTP